jgi:hypothetical protein
LALGAGGLAAGLLLAATGGAAQPSQAYVGGFCGPVALSDQGTAALKDHLDQWRAKPLSDAEADVARPADVTAPGQLFRLPGAGAPAVFIDRRKGACSLVFSGARVPPAVLEELATETLPVGEKGAPSAWRKVVRPPVGPPRPPRYFLKVGETEGFGLCSTLYEDLRLRDGAPATLVAVGVCHLLPSEKLDNG